jgi:phage RecT family recombinase
MTTATVPAAQAQQPPIAQLIARHETAIANALSTTPLKTSEFLIALRSAAIADPLINRCVQEDPGSVLACIMEAAQRGLRPGRVFGHFALIPRKVKARGNEPEYYTLTSIVEYRGLMHLAERCNQIEEMRAHVVFRGEAFSYDPRTREITHDPFDLDDKIARTEATALAAYAIVRIKGRSRPCTVLLRRQDIERIRSKSESWKFAKERSPWTTDWSEMWKKTAMRKALNSGEVPIAGSIADDIDESVPVEAPREQVAETPTPRPRLEVVAEEQIEHAKEQGEPEPSVASRVDPVQFVISATAPTNVQDGHWWFNAYTGEGLRGRAGKWDLVDDDDRAECASKLVAELVEKPGRPLELHELANLVVEQRRAGGK